MNKPLRVLSIDWDYLFKATIEQRITMFPDCPNESYPESLRSLIWGGRYAVQPELESITVDDSAVEIIMNLIKATTSEDTLITVWDSHANIYEEVTSRDTDGGLELINIDFHHDNYYEAQDVDCGNWVRYLFDKELSYRATDNDKYTWIKREDSDVPAEAFPEWFHEVENIEYLDKLAEEMYESDKHFDMVFICRSSMWSPPHLDGEFEKFIERLEEFSEPEINITGSRWTNDFIKSIAEERLATSQYLDKLQKH